VFALRKVGLDWAKAHMIRRIPLSDETNKALSNATSTIVKED
jgi:hypothetical protein